MTLTIKIVIIWSAVSFIIGFVFVFLGWKTGNLHYRPQLIGSRKKAVFSNIFVLFFSPILFCWSWYFIVFQREFRFEGITEKYLSFIFIFIGPFGLGMLLFLAPWMLFQIGREFIEGRRQK
jgi:hypothetical protein